MSKYRTHTCGELTLNNKDQKIKLSGWINKKRDHGNLLFLDLRDHYGLTQCVIDEGKKIFKEIEKLPLETAVSSFTSLERIPSLELPSILVTVSTFCSKCTGGDPPTAKSF